MEHDFNTLQDFMTYTKGVVYILLPLILIGFVGFWRFLSAQDREEGLGKE